ncbi:MAG: hypothetical protein ACYTEW_14560 [Planctomycetota bacterium]|jgi:hypothetical protein
MRTNITSRSSPRTIAIAVITAVVALSVNRILAVPAGTHRPFLTGPWELAVQMGHSGQMIRFPVEVTDEDKPEKMNKVLPVMGTPITIKLEQYLPDPKRESTAVEDANGGIVAKLVAKGKDFKQDIWLSSDEPARRSMSSSIGGVALRRLHVHDPNTPGKLLRELADSNGVGILSVWLPKADWPLEYVAKVGETITIQNSRYKASILRYVPDYAIDTKTKKVTSRSNKPANPAIKVSVNVGESAYERWLWSKSLSPHHAKREYPARMKFIDFDLGGMEGKYFLVTAFESEPWLLFSKEGKTQVEKAVPSKPYPFTNKEYSFSIDKIFDRSVIKTEWKNNSEELRHPTIIATVEEDNAAKRAVLELNKAYHCKTKSGTMVLLYRRQQR